MADGSPDLQALTRSFARFRYCSRLGCAGSGRASCGLGYMGISFRGAPGVRRVQAERGFAFFDFMGGHCPFRGLDAPLALTKKCSSECASQEAFVPTDVRSM